MRHVPLAKELSAIHLTVAIAGMLKQFAKEKNEVKEFPQSQFDFVPSV